MKNYFIIFPFLYFQKTRLNNFKAVVFHSYMEWISAILVLFFLEDMDLISSIKTFLIGYLSFISIYEIGYITNDHLSVKMEENPRTRIPLFSKSQVFFSIASRIIFFLAISYYSGFLDNPKWWIIFCFLAISYLLHNVIKNTDFRLFTFVNLCLLRILTPVAMFLREETMMMILPSVLLGYVFFRTFIYMDSKNQLRIESRKLPVYNMSYYLLMLPSVAFLSYGFHSLIPIVTYAYFAPLTVANYVKHKLIG